MQHKPTLNWYLTHSENPLDGTAKYPERPDAYLRVYLDSTRQDDMKWRWLANDWNLSGAGYEISKNLAIREAETAFFTYLGNLNKEVDLKLKIIKKTKVHAGERIEGRYPQYLIQEQVTEQLQGAFGGRYQTFGKGYFVYFAYTD